MEKELVVEPVLTYLGIEYRVLDTIKCPFCNSTSYLVLQAFVDKKWVNALCRCEQCNRKFTIVYRAEEIFSKAD